VHSLVADLARAIEKADAECEPAISVRSKRSYQAGIGPHTETSTLALVRSKLVEIDPTAYSNIETHIPYPSTPRQKCDWCWTPRSSEPVYIEAKMMRLMGDNGKPNDNILCHILSPYPQQHSALTDCRKLADAGFAGATAILIYGYEYRGFPLQPVIDAFETLASKVVNLTDAARGKFGGLIHPPSGGFGVCLEGFQQRLIGLATFRIAFSNAGPVRRLLCHHRLVRTSFGSHLQRKHTAVI